MVLICSFFLLAVCIVYDYHYLLFMYFYTFVTTWFMRIKIYICYKSKYCVEITSFSRATSLPAESKDVRFVVQ